MPLVLLLLLVPIVVIALMPLVLIQRYRAGKARRQARPWLVKLNVATMTFSAVCFVISAAFTTIWIPRSLSGAAIGLIAGLLLGGIGLAMTRWEATGRTLHYTPNAVLILLVTLIVSARLVYGLIRSVAAAQAGMSGTALVTAFGVPESLAAGAAVLGYYLAYNLGVLYFLRRT